MSKSIFQSTKSQYCELIAVGKKTIEVRKTRPKLDVPFKVYIYESKSSYINGLNGTVIGEYVCDRIEAFSPSRAPYETDSTITKASCLSIVELIKYSNADKPLYAWHISDLKIYDKPKELSEFFGACKQPKGTDCSVCRDNREHTCKSLTHPPQSWCYVEEL